MAGITRRVIMLDMAHRSGVIVPHDWAVVTTDVGTCAEPICSPWDPVSGCNTGFPRDPTDMIARVDAIMPTAIGQEVSILSFSSPQPLHGGSLFPRTGY